MKIEVKFAGFMGLNQFLAYQDKRLQGEAREMAFDLAMDLWEQLVEDTPRDTGRAKRSWQVLGAGQRTRRTKRGYYEIPTAPPHTPPSTGLKASSFRVVSDVDYMELLNEGHSKQAPAMFIETAIDKILAMYDGTKPR